MHSPTAITGVAFAFAALTSGSPIADPEITPFPNLVPTETVDLATDTTGVRNISPLRMPNHPVTLGKRDEPVTVDGIVYSTGHPDLVPSSTVDLATDSTWSTQVVSPTRMDSAMASSTASSSNSTSSWKSSTLATTTASPVTVDDIVYSTGFPDLVPESSVDLASDSTYSSQLVSPTRMVSAMTATTTAAASSTSAVSLEDDSAAKKETSGGLQLRPPMMCLWSAISWLR